MRHWKANKCEIASCFFTIRKSMMFVIQEYKKVVSKTHKWLMTSRRSTKWPCDIPGTTQSCFAPREGFFDWRVCNNVGRFQVFGWVWLSKLGLAGLHGTRPNTRPSPGSANIRRATPRPNPCNSNVNQTWPNGCLRALQMVWMLRPM
jgi:hypothetical protein